MPCKQFLSRFLVGFSRFSRVNSPSSECYSHIYFWGFYTGSSHSQQQELPRAIHHEPGEQGSQGVLYFSISHRSEERRADSLQETQVLNSSNKLLKTPNRCFCVFPAPYAGCVEAPADLQDSRCVSHTCFNIKAQVIGKRFITTPCTHILSIVP